MSLIQRAMLASVVAALSLTTGCSLIEDTVGNDDSSLLSLSLKSETNEAIKLYPSFSPSIKDYVASATFEQVINEIQVNAIANNSKADVAVTGDETQITEADNIVKVIVTAENGDRTTYTVDVVVAASEFTGHINITNNSGVDIQQLFVVYTFDTWGDSVLETPPLANGETYSADVPAGVYDIAALSSAEVSIDEAEAEDTVWNTYGPSLPGYGKQAGVLAGKTKNYSITD